MLAVPEGFLDIPYVGRRHPGAPDDGDLRAGANCQRFAYALLAHFGRVVPPLRSSDLWEDTTHTRRVQTLQPLDLLLWSRDGAAWGAHVGVYLGDGHAVHLCRAVGIPAIWPLSRFEETPRYRVLLGAKRATRVR